MDSQKIKVHLIHSDPVVRVGLTEILDREREVAPSTGEPTGGMDNRIIIADYYGGIRFYNERKSQSQHFGLRLLIVTFHEKDSDIRYAIESGIHGYVLHGDVPQELLKAIRILHNGGCYFSEKLKQKIARSFGNNEGLTVRETDVLQLLGLGYCNKLIARELGVGLETVKSHMKSILVKLKVTARTQAVIVATQQGLLRTDFIPISLAAALGAHERPVPRGRMSSSSLDKV